MIFKEWEDCGEESRKNPALEQNSLERRDDPVVNERSRLRAGTSTAAQGSSWKIGCLPVCLGWGWSPRPAKFFVQLCAVLWVGTWSSDSMPSACMCCTYWNIWGIVRHGKLILGVWSCRAILASIPYKNIILRGVVKKITSWKVNFLPKWMKSAR